MYVDTHVHHKFLDYWTARTVREKNLFAISCLLMYACSKYAAEWTELQFG